MCISLLSSDIILLRDNRIFLQYSILAQLYKKCKTFCQDVDFVYKPLDKSDVYETKYISGVKPLTKGTKKIIKSIHK